MVYRVSLECLRVLVVAAYALSGCLQAVAQGEYVDEQAVRRAGVVEVCRVTSLAVVPLVVTQNSIVEWRQSWVELQKPQSATRMTLYNLALHIGERS